MHPFCRDSHSLLFCPHVGQFAASAVQTIEDLLAWPHLEARGMVVPVEHPVLGTLELKAAGFPLKFGDAKTGYEGAASPTGSDTRAVLADLLGLGDAELDELAGKGAI